MTIWPFCLPWILRCWVRGHEPMLTHPRRGSVARWQCSRCLMDLGATLIQE